jgi:hypothetical protein
MAENKLFAPRKFPVRMPTDNSMRNGAVLNPPRLPQIGGMTKSNADQKEGTLTIKKPGGTR